MLFWLCQDTADEQAGMAPPDTCISRGGAFVVKIWTCEGARWGATRTQFRPLRLSAARACAGHAAVARRLSTLAVDVPIASGHAFFRASALRRPCCQISTLEGREEAPGAKDLACFQRLVRTSMKWIRLVKNIHDHSTAIIFRLLV